MATLPFTVTKDVNNAFTSAVDGGVWYREGVFNLIAGLIAAGGVHVCSSDGVNTSSVANQITTTADIVWGTNGSQNLSYIVLQFGTGVGAQYILISCENSNADTTPNSLAIRVSSDTYTLAGTPLQNRPTTTGNETTVLTVTNFIPATLGAANWGWIAASTENRMVFWIKRDANADVVTWVIIHRRGVTPSDTSGDAQPYGLVIGAGTTFTVAQLQSTSNWRGHDANGAALSSWTGPQCNAWVWSSWPSGQAANLVGRLFPIVFGHNGSTTVTARYLGTMFMLYGVPPLTPTNSVDPTDPGGDTEHYQSLGVVAPFVDKADGPFS